MMDIKLKFTTTKRDGKIALWVNELNIWDLTKKEFTPAVKEAIICAVGRGVELERASHNTRPKIEDCMFEKWVKRKAPKNDPYY